MKRKLIVLLSVISILFCVAIPCFAADIDYNDYIYNVELDGDNDIVSVSIPVSSLTSINWRVWDRSASGQPLVAEAYGSSFSYAYNPSKTYMLAVAPFYGDFLDLRDIPDGTTITFSYSVTGAAYAGESGIQARVNATYYGSQHQNLHYVNGPVQGGQFFESNEVAYTLDKPTGASFGRFGISFVDFTMLGSGTRTVTLDSVTFKFSIASLTRLQQETGRTNKILSQIEDKIDGIIDYVPTPGDPSDGLGDAFDDAEQEVVDKVETGRDEIDTIIDEFAIYLDEFLPGIVVVSNWLTVLLEVKFIRVLLFFSLAFGMCGLFLGVANSFRGKS